MPPMTDDFFTGFERFDVAVDHAHGGTTLHGVRGGEGPPLLLHGYPQARAMWHRVAPRLAERFTVVAPDLRGYFGNKRGGAGSDLSLFDPLALWRARADEVSGRALPGGHYLAEQCPDGVLAEIVAFMGAAAG